MSSEAFAPLRFPPVSGGGVDAAVAEAVQRGYATGLARGRRRANAERDELLAVVEADAAARRSLADERLAHALEALEEARRALDRRVAPVLEEAVSSMLEAGLALAEAVLGAELEHDGLAARAALARVLAHPDAGAATTVRMSRASIEALRVAGVEAPVALTPDAALAPGDAVAELPDGLIDATISAALARARRELLGELA